MQKTKGISLIVLVITIIVMIILAGAIILTLNNSGIIDKASHAVEETNLDMIKELAQMAWGDAYADEERDVVKLQEAVDKALQQNNITKDMYKGYTIKATTSGVEFIKVDPALNHSGTIPEGATYSTGNEYEHIEEDSYVVDNWNYDNAITYTAGDKFPETVSLGDIYIYGDYEYRYGVSYDEFMGEWTNANSTNGWGVLARENKTEYGSILESINESNIVDMSQTFVYCSLLTTSPKIPNTVEYMDYTFGDTGIVSAPEIPQGVTSMAGTFRGCTALTTAPKIPSSVMRMPETFRGCTALTGNVEINTNNITNNSYGSDGSGNSCFADTTQPIKLTGTASNAVKELLSKTSSKGNVTY